MSSRVPGASAKNFNKEKNMKNALSMTIVLATLAWIASLNMAHAYKFYEINPDIGRSGREAAEQQYQNQIIQQNQQMQQDLQDQINQLQQRGYGQ
jgi:uncharacterized protein YlxW (UPF0749 family)